MGNTKEFNWQLETQYFFHLALHSSLIILYRQFSLSLFETYDHLRPQARCPPQYKNCTEHQIHWVPATVHFLTQMPPKPQCLTRNGFGIGLGWPPLKKSHNYLLPKLVPNPFFGKYFFNFNIKGKFMVRCAENNNNMEWRSKPWLRYEWKPMDLGIWNKNQRRRENW